MAGHDTTTNKVKITADAEVNPLPGKLFGWLFFMDAVILYQRGCEQHIVTKIGKNGEHDRRWTGQGPTCFGIPKNWIDQQIMENQVSEYNFVLHGHNACQNTIEPPSTKILLRNLIFMSPWSN